uniref:Uncharacterized protein n=1 Tax=Sus scrofa TaxID=9823 RepID=A0A4X1VAL0_PIG
SSAHRRGCGSVLPVLRILRFWVSDSKWEVRAVWQKAQPGAARSEASGCLVVGTLRGRRWTAGTRKPGGRPWEGARPGGDENAGRTCAHALRPLLRSQDRRRSPETRRPPLLSRPRFRMALLSPA